MTAMAPGKLLAYWATRPTVMPMQEEMSLIRDMRALDTADIAKDLASFISLSRSSRSTCRTRSRKNFQTVSRAKPR
jgi:hypothetical protein